ncbi:cytochrome c [Paenibacillus sp. J5C_2022]|uniref:c-type cytochrome n=1 Tax=Paenibacillus sp. J5C2022 TaxID=2977129 RepID=UPI0021D053F7|nr:cytochrome c [Paenibacillus sp. J5C2022]MCU6712211.1 cytochrome c [Paenibacillus sp. J5C2022]
MGKAARQRTRIQEKRSIAMPLITVIAAASLTLAAGCGQSVNEGDKVRLKDAPAAVEAVYKAQCLSCHGSELQGLVGGNTNLQQVGERMSYEAIAMQIEEGGGLMQPYKDVLSEEEINGLATWLAGSGQDQ